MLRDNADARRCSYFEHGLPVILHLYHAEFQNSLVVPQCPALVQSAFSEIWYWNNSFEHGSIFEADPAFRYCESGIELTQFLANGDVPCEQSFLCGLAYSISEVICLAVSRVFG